MIKFVLNKEEIIERKLPDKFDVIETKDPYTIQTCIELFNSNIQWSEMFTLLDALGRIDDGERMFIGCYNNEIFGYCWVMDEGYDTYIYNVFSKKTIDRRKYGATDMLYYVIKNYGNKTISAQVDEWNTKSIRVFEKLGFKPN